MELPVIGFGTLNKSEGLSSDIREAISSGYQHVDSAEMYKTSPNIKEALESGEVKREKVFITSKLSGLPFGEYNAVKNRTQLLLQGLGVSQVDLLLIHWPGAKEIDLQASPSLIPATIEENISFRDHFKDAWANMIKLQEDGLTRFIGVSNFYQKHLEQLLAAFPNHVPYANQIFIDFFHQEPELVNFMTLHSIRVIAYRPIVFCNVYAFIEPVNEFLQSCAKECGASSVQQFLLAYFIHNDIHVLCSTTNSEHIQENIKAMEVAKKITSSMTIKCQSFSKEHKEMVIMYGGTDEYANVFRNQ